MTRGRIRAWVLAAVISLAGTGCVTNPATGKKSFILISPEQEISLGAEAQPQFIKDYGGEVPSPPVLEYVRNIGKQLAAVSERPDQPWEFHVLDSNVINAFALPGGKVFITRGLLSKLEDEAQLAGVLGHECGHVCARHTAQRMSQALVVQGVATGFGVVGEISNKDYLRVLGVGAQAGGTVYLLKFSRDEESEADALGVRYMTKLGYNPVAQIRVMEILKREAGSGSTPEFLATHPYPDTRIARLNKLIKKQYPDYDDFNKYHLYPDRFKTSVLTELAKLPAPRTQPK
jgi:predicted Zn-dependent protease